MIEKFTVRQFERKGRKERRPAGHHEDMFLCRHCHRIVPAGAGYSGVQNRNHCPYCLHSRHLDLTEAGDRLSACKGVMKPVGLTCKKSLNKYMHRQSRQFEVHVDAQPDRQSGELMLIHQCVECGKVSINRIARDDDAELIFEHFCTSLEMPPGIRNLLEERGITVLGTAETEFVAVRLFGRGGTPLADR